MRNKLSCVVLMFLLATTFAAAQATRTWVSGVGDDANPCSRTAPCKTFAGAISKTASGGEIDALDPAGYGAVTITKPITIDGGGGQVASILAAGTTGIIVNAGTGVVTLRNLRINGAGTGINGIDYKSGGKLIVENCDIFGFTTNGIWMESNSLSRMVVRNSTATNNALAGIRVDGGRADIEGSNLSANGYGLLAYARVTAVRTIASHNSQRGFAISGGGDGTLTDCSATNNVYGVTSSSSMVRISNMTITGNNTGLSGSQIVSWGNNFIAGNSTDGTPTSTIAQQ